MTMMNNIICKKKKKVGGLSAKKNNRSDDTELRMVEQSFRIPLAFQQCSPFVNVWKDVSKEGVRKKMTDTMMPQTGKVLLTTRIAGASGTTTLKIKVTLPRLEKGVVVGAPAVPISARIVAW